MTDPHQPEQSAGGEGSGQDPTPAPTPPPTVESTVEAEEPQPEVAPVAPVARRQEFRKGLLLGLGGGVLAAAVVVALAAFVWPAYLVGPGKPDDKAAEAVAALAGKNTAELARVSCHRRDGKPAPQMTPQALQLIQAVKQSGPLQLPLDTFALVPVTMTLGAQGQTQDIAVDVVLGVTDGEWCMNGMSQR